MAIGAPTQASPDQLRTAFLGWLDSRPPLACAIATRNVADGIRFEFVGYTPFLRGFIGHHCCQAGSELLVDAEYKGIWDALLWPDGVCPERRPGGWVCATCESEGRDKVFESAEAIWQDHLFDPLLQWVNTKLAPAHDLAFFDDDGAMWVTLDRTEGATYIVPLKEGS